MHRSCERPIPSPPALAQAHPRRARQALGLLLVPPETRNDELKPAIDFFDQLEIYPGTNPLPSSPFPDDLFLPA